MLRIIWIVLFALCAWSCIGLGQENRDPDIKPRERDLPPMARAVMLYGGGPDGVYLRTTGEIMKVQYAEGEPRIIEYSGLEPSITLDGNVVASALWKSYRPRRLVIATYSVPEKKWTEYAEGDFNAGVAISPDGARLAYLGNSEETDCGYSVRRIHVIDRKTLHETIEPMPPCVQPKPEEMRPDGSIIVRNVWEGSRMGMSFSPRGERLAYGGYPIRVWDIDNNTEKEVAAGHMPAWSPDGEWIGYIDSERDQRHSTLGLVHADGSGDKIVITLPRDDSFDGSPVWSPDSKSVLLNVNRGHIPAIMLPLDYIALGFLIAFQDIWPISRLADKLFEDEPPVFDMRLLDVRTLKLKTVRKDIWPVHGWAKATGH